LSNDSDEQFRFFLETLFSVILFVKCSIYEINFTSIEFIFFNYLFVLISVFIEDEPRKHFVRPDNFQVTWWPGEYAQDNINSDSTAGIINNDTVLH